MTHQAQWAHSSQKEKIDMWSTKKLQGVARMLDGFWTEDAPKAAVPRQGDPQGMMLKKNTKALIFAGKWDSESSSLQMERARGIILLCVTQICINISFSRAATREVY